MRKFWICACWCMAIGGAWAQKSKKMQPLAYQQYLLDGEAIGQLDNRQEKVKHFFCGHFTNKAQADTTQNPLFKKPQEIIGLPVWQDKRPGETWVYMNWIPAGQPEVLLSHSLFQILRHNRDSFLVKAYNLPERPNGLRDYNLVWAQENPLAEVESKELTLSGQLWVYEVQPNRWAVDSDLLAIPSMGGSVISFLELDMRLEAGQLISFAKFYNKDRQFLFGAPQEGSIFQRLPKHPPLYPQLPKLAPAAKKARKAKK